MSRREPELSKGLWDELGLDPNTQLDRMSLGPNADYWAVAQHRSEESQSVCCMDPTLRGQLWKLQGQYHFDDFQYVSLGAEGTYAYSVGGKTHTRAMDPALKSELQRAKIRGTGRIGEHVVPELTRCLGWNTDLLTCDG